MFGCVEIGLNSMNLTRETTFEEFDMTQKKTIEMAYLCGLMMSYA